MCYNNTADSGKQVRFLYEPVAVRRAMPLHYRGSGSGQVIGKFREDVQRCAESKYLPAKRLRKSSERLLGVKIIL